MKDKIFYKHLDQLINDVLKQASGLVLDIGLCNDVCMELSRRLRKTDTEGKSQRIRILAMVEGGLITAVKHDPLPEGYTLAFEVFDKDGASEDAEYYDKETLAALIARESELQEECY